ncbi:MAG: outer membrane protein assembly factor BamC [Gammaproteobacteria bacterium WSBS_2016_MAG_OTU1]
MRKLRKPLTPKAFFALAVAFAAAFVLSACGATTPVQDIIEGRKVDYEQEKFQSSKELQYPPDIISNIDSNIAGQELLSEYRIEAVPDIAAVEEVELGEARKVIYRRQGNLRWIDVDLPPGEAWQLATKFWVDLDFSLIKQDAALGVMETDWLDLRQDSLALGLGAYLNEFIKRVRDSGERDKFITRIDPRDEYSSIFVAHRHVAATFDGEGVFSSFEALQSDSNIESEMLRRIMIYAARKSEAEAETAFKEEITTAEAAAEEDYDVQITTLFIDKPIEESWLLVRIGLDRGGFTIDDLDFAELTYYISHTGGPESNQIFGKVNTSFLNKIFGDDEPVLREIKMILTTTGEDQTSITVQANDDEGELSEAQKAVLLELLSVNLP